MYFSRSLCLGLATNGLSATAHFYMNISTFVNKLKLTRMGALDSFKINTCFVDGAYIVIYVSVPYQHVSNTHHYMVIQFLLNYVATGCKNPSL